MDTLKLTVHYFLSVIFWLVICLVIICLAVSFLSGSSLTGSHHLYIVQSGSMEPTIMTGDVIVTGSQSAYHQNDVITFNNQERGVVTHRIAQVVTDGLSSNFITKGDANRTTDSDNITAGQIIGKVIFILPKLGYLVIFSRQPLGFILLLGVPGLIILLEEIAKALNKHPSAS